MNEILINEEMDKLVNLLMNYSINYIITGKKQKDDILNVYKQIEEYIDFNEVSEDTLEKFNNIKIIMNIYDIKDVEFEAISNNFVPFDNQGVLSLLQKSIFNN